MRFLILANGTYGDLDWYRERLSYDRIICVDGGGEWAVKLGLVPDWIVGDMDSIDSDALTGLQEAGAKTFLFEVDKDETDTQLAILLAAQKGAASITVWGGTGTRLDHTISNLFSAATLVNRGISVRFESPGEDIDIIQDTFMVKGNAGETVSLLVIGEKATGVTLQGFKYPLINAELKADWQWAVSNVIAEPNPIIRLAAGVLAVIHYRSLPE
ncbi:MAG: thiamine diphosphokinase [Ignavibacteriales bacterium]